MPQVSMPIPSNNTGRTHDARCSTLERFLRSAAALRTWPHSTSSVDCTGCLPSCTVLMGLPLSYHVLDLKTIMPAIARFGEDGDRIKTGRQAVDPHPLLGGVIGLVGDVEAVVVYLITLIDLCAIDREVIGLVAHDTPGQHAYPQQQHGQAPRRALQHAGEDFTFRGCAGLRLPRAEPDLQQALFTLLLVK